MTIPTERNLTADRLAQYVKRNRCERFLRFSLFKSEADNFARRYAVRFESLSPLLSESGQSYECEVIKELKKNGATVRDLFNKLASDFLDQLAAQKIGLKVFYYQAKLTASIGLIECEGIADLILVEKLSADSFNVCVVDIKSSRRETTGYRLQVAFYARLLEEMFTQRNWSVNNLTGAIHLKGKTLSADEIETFELGLYADEIERLVAAEHSDVARVVKAAFADTVYHLNYNCDGCRYNAACFVQAAETEDLSLIPQLTATEKFVLKSEDCDTLGKVARLYEYGNKEMTPAAQKEKAESLNKNWALSGKVPIIAQRARAALHRFDKTTEFRSFIVGSDFGTLPDTNRYPEIIRVFVDTQHDYLCDRLYMFSAVVAGPAHSKEICEIAEAPPDDKAEQQLLIKGVQKLLSAIAETADSTHAPVHFYLFDRRSQEKLKAALTRHFAALCAIPAFYDLLTASPVLSQPMISFLADDVSARRNLKNLGQNLYQVAGEMKFDWTGETSKIKERFRAKIFDNFRKYSRSDAGEFAPADRQKANERDVWIEASARFGTEIPLEYAYAAWGELEAPENLSDAARMQLEGFLGTTLEEIRGLATLRCRALQHIEESFGYKNRDIEKQELNLTKLHEIEIEPEEVPLARAVEDFLFLEHHARRQEAYLFFALPPDVRAAAGRCAIIRNEDLREENKEPIAEFSFSDVQGNQVSDAVEQKMMRFREGDWVVLNELKNENGKFPFAKSIVTGRLAIVKEIDSNKIVLTLSSMCKPSTFRFAHRLFKPEAGRLYTIDQMLDDFNSDKFLLACRNAETTNPLYRWLTDEEEGKEPRLIRPSRKRHAQKIAELANDAQQLHDLTEAQKEVIGDCLEEKAFVLQGPPGTGKSHTLGFAVLARILALKVQGRPFRVAISAKTHAAVKIALGSIAKSAKILKKNIAGESLLAPLENLKIYKLCSELSETVPEGVTAISPDGDEELKAAAHWDKLEAEDVLIVGGTPGMLFNLIKRGANRGRKEINWAAQYFDLVVVDEASQMGLAEALTATAFLKSDGQFIAIGDHRQMPPILAHAWDRESRRDLEKIKPHLSIFEYLQKSGFKSRPLDESFRIPAEVAEFLNEHIYRHDGVNFHSKNRKRITAIDEFSEEWLAHVFAPEHPLVLVEHAEDRSAHHNEFEAALVEKIIRLARAKIAFENEEESIGVVVPHRAQKAILQTRLPEIADSIDTVERFQGGERDLIIVSATVSSRDFAAAEMEFLLDPRRLTVAISRPKQKIIVVASQTVFNLIPSDLDDYERGSLWKHLHRDCRSKVLWQGKIENQAVNIFAR